MPLFFVVTAAKLDNYMQNYKFFLSYFELKQQNRGELQQNIENFSLFLPIPYYFTKNLLILHTHYIKQGMKRLIIFTTVAVLTMSACAQSSEVKKYIKKYDVQKITCSLPKGDAKSFWNQVRVSNKKNLELEQAQQSKSKTLEEAMQILAFAVTVNQESDIISQGHDSITKKLSNDLGIQKLTTILPIRIISSSEVNASMDALGQMRINIGAIGRFSYEELLAVCAHETAHFACSHALSRTWKTCKRQKTNKFWAELETGLLVGAAAATAGYGIANGQQMNAANTILANPDIFLQEAYSDAEGATTRYFFRYSREEEVEADIIAYRFMEFMGYQPKHYISALKKLQQYDNRAATGKYESHPIISIRIETLQAMMNGLSGKGTEYQGKPTTDDVFK